MESIKVYEIYTTLWYNPFWLNSLCWYAIFAVICVSILLILVLLLFYKKKKIHKSAFPWDLALQELDRLKPEHFEGYERRKEFYSEVTRILKTYFGARYGTSLLDKTEYESLRHLEYSIGSSLVLERLQSILSGAVLAKFSPDDVMQKKMNEHLAESVLLIQDTKPQPLDTFGKLEK